MTAPAYTNEAERVAVDVARIAHYLLDGATGYTKKQAAKALSEIKGTVPIAFAKACSVVVQHLSYNPGFTKREAAYLLAQAVRSIHPNIDPSLLGHADTVSLPVREKKERTKEYISRPQLEAMRLIYERGEVDITPVNPLKNLAKALGVHTGTLRALYRMEILLLDHSTRKAKLADWKGLDEIMADPNLKVQSA